MYAGHPAGNGTGVAGNCRLVVLSEPAASERTAEVVDYLLSDHELRPGTPLYTEGEAAELLNPPELPGRAAQ